MSRILIVLNYYAPYVSGLTNVARDVAEGLAARGHEVTVVTSQHDSDLPRESTLNGVRVVRCPVRLRLGKGVVSFSFIPTVLEEAQRADVVNLHAPMLESGLIARGLQRRGIPFVFTYHCDVALPDTVLGATQNRVMDASSRAAARRAAYNVVTSDDYAGASRIADALQHRQRVIPPGCHLRLGGAASFRTTPGLHVGFLGRFVAEKGIEYLVEGFSRLEDPDARLLLAGDYSAVAGGSVIDRVRARISDDDRIRVLGFIDDDMLADFYASLDVFALVSVNAFEAFGIVQAEAMMAGVPAMATDMPGVRQPVGETNFGVVVPPRDASAIEAALQTLRTRSFDRAAGAAAARDRYELTHAVDAYEQLFAQADAERRGSRPPSD